MSLLGWFAYLDSCIKYFATNSNFNESYLLCRDNNAYLVVTESVNKFIFLRNRYLIDFSNHMNGAAWVSSTNTCLTNILPKINLYFISGGKSFDVDPARILLVQRKSGQPGLLGPR